MRICFSLKRLAAVCAVMLSLGMTAQAQFTSNAIPDDFRDTTVLRPPPGAKVAVLVFEDLGCPACAHGHPIETEVAKETGVALVRRDFPLEQHIWTFQGAVVARYLQDHVGQAQADQFRSDVFHAQASIASKDDLQQFTQQWFQRHGLAMPFVLDPGGKLAAEVKADYDLGVKLNVMYTPTIVVVTRDRYQVISGGRGGAGDIEKLEGVVQAAIKEANAAPAAKRH